MDDPKLPGSYGRTRLVLLVVDPYLVHAYWEVTPGTLRQAKGGAEQTKAVLRFYKGSEAAGEGRQQGSFDIKVDLQSPNWYVHLWAPEESLYAELALTRNDGTLIRLTRSQVVHMPRARAVVSIDQHFMKVEATERRAEIVPAPPPPAKHRPPQEAMTIRSKELDALPIAVDSAQAVRETLTEVYASVRWPGRSRPETVRVFSTAPLGGAGTDLTSIAERSFAPGLSSGVFQKNPAEGGTD